MYYDQAGKMKSAGAETTSTRVLDDAEDEGWIKVEWYVSVLLFFRRLSFMDL